MGVNTFLNPQPENSETEIELARSTDEEKDMQISDLEKFNEIHGIFPNH